MTEEEKPTDEELLETLHSFKKEKFRSFQKKTIRHILDGKDVLAVVPTGGGKSYCYQVPAMHLSGITLVISPLLALIEDQVKTLRGIKIDGYEAFPVACLTSAFMVDHKGFHYDNVKETDAQGKTITKRSIRNGIFDGASRGEYKLMYITPERLRSAAFVQFARNTQISMIAVDEAHCISLWGYEFRRQYLMISAFLDKIGYHPVIAAFTATATKPVRDDIIKLLKMKSCKYPNGKGKLTKRDNLNFSVFSFMDAKSKSSETGKKNRLLMDYLNDRKGERGYIYCSTVETVNKLYQRLKKEGLPVTRFYSRLDDGDDIGWNESKKSNFEKFKSSDDQKSIMITTNALGMGIDISDIRFVIHYNMPLCLENYYQEAGRGGRDHKPSDCILFFSKRDIAKCHMLIESSIRSSGLTEADKEKRRAIANVRLAKMTEYAMLGTELNSDALQDRMIEYFNKYDPTEDEKQEIQKIKEKRRKKEEGAKEEEEKEDAHSRMDVYSDIKRITVLFSNRTKVAQELRKGNMSSKEVEDKKYKKKKLDKYAGLEVGRKYGEEEDHNFQKPTVKYKVTGEEPLTYFDMMVADAVYTLMYHRVPVIYARNVMMLLSGDRDILLRPEKKVKVEESIRKMMNTHIVIDRSESLNCGFEYSDNGDKTKVIEGSFLPLYENKGAANKDRGFSYSKGAVPPLYKYAEISNGQFFTFPTELLRFNKPESENPKQKDKPKSSKDLFMERRVKIYKFYHPGIYEEPENKPNRYKNRLQRRALPPQSEKDLGKPENPLLPERFLTTKENLSILHYLLCRIDMMQQLYERKRFHSVTKSIIRFDTLVKTLGIDMKTDKSPSYTRRKADDLWRWIVMILKHCKSLDYIKDYELIIKYPDDGEKSN